MEASYHRHDISDEVWALLEPHLPGQRGQWGGIAQDNRRFALDQVDSFFTIRSGTFCNKDSDWHTIRIHGQTS